MPSTTHVCATASTLAMMPLCTRSAIDPIMSPSAWSIMLVMNASTPPPGKLASALASPIVAGMGLPAATLTLIR